MTRSLQALLIGSIFIVGAGAQDSNKMVLTKGVSVRMPVAAHAVEMRAADEPNARVVAVAADGKVFNGTQAIDPATLGNLSEHTVYLKADSQAPYQTVLTVLDALRGKTVVLLSAPPGNAARRGILPPYGMKLIVSR